MRYNGLISPVLIFGFALSVAIALHSPDALAQTALNKPPTVFAPADIFVGVTETGGARGSADSTLAAFLAGGKFKDAFDPHPVALPPQVNGINADNNTLFPEGATVVTFRFQDFAGSIGSASAKVTVVDLQSGDLFVGGASVAGGIFRVRGSTSTLYCQPESGSTFDPRFWNIPQDVMVDPQGRVVFVAYLGSFSNSQQGLGLFRCGSLGATPELLAVFPDGAGRPITDPLPFGKMRFGAESGLHMEEVREVIINDLNTVPKLVTEDVYALALAAGGTSSPTGFIKSARYHPTSGIWDDGPDLGTFVGRCDNGFQCRMPDIAFHSGTTYVAGGSILRKDKIPLRLDASGTIGGVSFQLSLGLFGSAGELSGTTLHDSSFPTVPSGCKPAPPLQNDMPLVDGTFRSLAGVHDVIYDEYNGFGLVLVSGSVGASAPYLTNISEALLDHPDPSLFFQDNFFSCAAAPELNVSSPLPFFGMHGINGSNSLVSAPNGVFGVSNNVIVQMAPGVDATDQRVVASGLPITGFSGLGAWPPKLSAGIGANIIIRIDSPVNVLVTDVNGKSIGVNAAGDPVNDFGQNGFDSGPGEPRFYAINNPAPGTYSVQAIGTGNGPYTVHVYSADFSFPAGSHVSTSGVTSVGQMNSLPFTVDASMNVAFSNACAQDLTSSVIVARGGYRYNFATGRFVQSVAITNSGAAAVTGPILLALDGLSSNASLFNATGSTTCAAPLGSSYVTVVPSGATLASGASATTVLQFNDPTRTAIKYAIRVLGGSGQP